MALICFIIKQEVAFLFLLTPWLAELRLTLLILNGIFMNTKTHTKTKNISTLSERIRRCVKFVGNANLLSEKTKIPRRTLENYISGESEPNVSRLTLIAKVSGVSVAWLATGEGVPDAGTVNEYALHDVAEQEAFKYDYKDLPFRYIPLINMSASAGDGTVVTEEKSAALLAFDKEYLWKKWSVHTGDLFCMEVSGESMSPTLENGELLICSHDVKDIDHVDGIYIIRMEGSILVKRVQRLPGERLRISSDNESYKPYEVNLDDGLDFAILGKVMLVNGLRRL